MSRYYARVHAPAQESTLKVRPARNGVRLELDGRHINLDPRTAHELADALVDSCESDP